MTRADQGELGQFVNDRTLPDVRRDLRVWAVVLAGDFPGECILGPGGTPSCMPDLKSALVVVRDGGDGEILLTEYPAPEGGS